MRFYFFRRAALPAAALLCSLTVSNTAAYSQSSVRITDTIVASGTLIERGIAKHDDGNYKAALKLYRQVPEGDTNYYLAVYEQVLSLVADSSYAEARNLAFEALRWPAQSYRHDLLLQAGHALDYMGKADSARALYDTLIRRNPYDHQPVYETAATYYRAEDYPTAARWCQRALLINPSHFRSHFLLGMSLSKMGRVPEAYLALCASLLVTGDRGQAGGSISQLSDLANNTDEVATARRARTAAHPMWDEIDAVLEAKLQLDKDYRFDSELAGDPVVNTLHAILQKLEYNPRDTGFVMQFYAPLYVANRSDGFDGLVLHMFSGYGIESIEKKARRAGREVTDARDEARAYLSQILTTGVLNYEARKKAPMRRAFESARALYGVGNLKSADPLDWNAGPVTFYQRGELFVTGAYDAAGKRTGVWKTYYPSGVLQEEVTYKAGELTGESRTFYPNGAPKERKRFNAEGKLVEEWEYNRGGIPTAQAVASGSDATVRRKHLNGVEEVSFNLHDGELVDGVYTFHDDKGRKTSEITFRNGDRTGPFKDYFPDGKLKEEGRYVDGEYDGTIKTYFADGTLRVSSVWNAGRRDGVYEDFHPNGKRYERTEYRRGKREGEAVFYDSTGRQYGSITYKGGLPTAYRFTAPDGKVLASGSDAPFVRELPWYSAEGYPVSLVSYNSEGMHGTAKYFHRTGVVRREETYRDGEENGPSTDYYQGGKKKAERMAKDGSDENGMYRGWYTTGKKEAEGVLVRGTRTGIWRWYAGNGTMTEEEFYVDGKNNGPDRFFDGAGRPTYANLYDRGILIGMVEYDTNGKERSRTHFPAAAGTYLMQYPNGKAEFTVPLVGGSFHGAYTNYYPDGSTSQTGFFRRGQRDSTFVSYYPTGVVKQRGSYRVGQPIGVWKYYDEAGALLVETPYKDGEQHGVEKRYRGGELREAITYKEGEKDGDYTLYGEGGAVAGIFIYDMGLLTGYTSMGAGNVRKPVTRVEKGTAHVQTAYASGARGVDYTITNNVDNGTQTIYFANGKKAEEYRSIMSDMDGTFTQWYPNGQVARSLSYTKDVIEGPDRTYAPDGKLLSEVPYTGGYRHGRAVYLNPTTGKKRTLTVSWGEDMRLE